MTELKAAQPSNKFFYIQAEVSLISRIDLASQKILQLEKKVDYLCISPGGMPFKEPFVHSKL
jgi:hypothetical protein